MRTIGSLLSPASTTLYFTRRSRGKYLLSRETICWYRPNNQYIGILLHVVYRRKLFNVRITCFIRCNFNHNLVRWSCAMMCETNNYWLSTIIKSHTIFLTKRIRMINRIKKIRPHCCYRNTMMNQKFQRTAGNWVAITSKILLFSWSTGAHMIRWDCEIYKKEKWTKGKDICV